MKPHAEGKKNEKSKTIQTPDKIKLLVGGGGNKQEVNYSAVDVSCGPNYTMVVGQKNVDTETCVITCLEED